MTSTEMKYEFQVRNELLPGLDSPDLEDEEINMFLNSAQIKLVENLYAKGLTQLLTELYITLTSTGYLDYTTGGITNAKSWSIDTSSYMFFINGTVLINKSPTGSERIKCILIDKKDSFDFAKTSKNVVWFEYPKIFIDGSEIVVIVDSDTTIPEGDDQLKTTFIKKPSLIDVTDDTENGDCKLKDILHIDIIEEAVKQVTSTYKLRPNTEEAER